MTDQQIAAKVAVGVAEANLKAAERAERKALGDLEAARRYTDECRMDMEFAINELKKLRA